MGWLHELQQMDTQIGSIQRTIRGLDDGTNLRQELEALNRERDAASAELKGFEVDYYDKELKLKGVEDKIKKNRDRLFSGTIGNPKELQDLNEEVQSLTRQKGELEEGLLGMMDELDSRRKTVKQQRSLVDVKLKDLERIEKDYAEERQRHEGEIGEMQQQRSDFVGCVDENLLEQYELIRAHSANLAVVKVQANKCPGCSMQLTSFLLKQLKALEDLVQCESCGRILYSDEE